MIEGAQIFIGIAILLLIGFVASKLYPVEIVSEPCDWHSWEYQADEKQYKCSECHNIAGEL